MRRTDVDGQRIIYHPKRVAEWQECGDCFPIYVEIGLTNRCNHRCVFCALDYLEKGGFDLKKEVIISTLKDMADHGVKSIMLAGEGESVLHSDIVEIVEKAKEYGLDISITTNGALFTKEKAERIIPKLSWIRFSLDAASPENYAKIHGTHIGDFNNVIRNIKDAVDVRNATNSNTIIGVQFLLISENVHELLEAAKIVKSTGADNIQIKPYSHHPSSKNDYSVDYSKLEWLEDELKKLEDDNFQVMFRKKTMKRIEQGRTYKECHGLPFFALIDAQGNVIPCNIFYNNPEFTYGNLNESSFSQIWKSEKRKQIIQKIKERGIDVCRHGCRLDPINRFLNDLKYPHPHINFI